MLKILTHKGHYIRSLNLSFFSFGRHPITRIGDEIKLEHEGQKKRQKIQRILSGNDYQITTYKIISTNKFQHTIMTCVVLNILLLILPTMPTRGGLVRLSAKNFFA